LPTMISVALMIASTVSPGFRAISLTDSLVMTALMVIGDSNVDNDLGRDKPLVDADHLAFQPVSRTQLHFSS
jgi:hypothetical protein